MNAKKEVVLSEIENHLLSEGIDGLAANQKNIVLSTIEIESKPEFDGANGTWKLTAMKVGSTAITSISLSGNGISLRCFMKNLIGPAISASNSFSLLPG